MLKMDIYNYEFDIMNSLQTACLNLHNCKINAIAWLCISNLTCTYIFILKRNAWNFFKFAFFHVSLCLFY